MKSKIEVRKNYVRSAIDSSLTPGPKNSTNLPTTPTYITKLFLKKNNVRATRDL